MNKSTGSKNQTPNSRSPGARPVHTARTPLFPHKQPSLRIGPQQVQGAKRTLDGEDRSGIIQGEGKGDSCPPRDFRGGKRGKERSGEARSSAASDER